MNIKTFSFAFGVVCAVLAIACIILASQQNPLHLAHSQQLTLRGVAVAMSLGAAVGGIKYGDSLLLRFAGILWDVNVLIQAFLLVAQK